MSEIEEAKNKNENQSELDALHLEHEKLKERQSVLETQISLLIENETNINKEKEELQLELIEKNTNFQNLKEQYQNEKSTNASLHSKITELSYQLTEQEKKATEDEENYNKQVQELKTKESILNLKWEEKILLILKEKDEIIEKKYKEFNMQLEKLEKEKRDIKDLSAHTSNLLNDKLDLFEKESIEKLKSLTLLVEKNKETIEKYEKDNIQLQSEKDDILKQNQNFVHRITGMESQIVNLKAENLELTKAAKENLEIKDTISIVREENIQLNKMLKTHEEEQEKTIKEKCELTKSKQKLEKSLNDLEKQLETFKLKYQQDIDQITQKHLIESQYVEENFQKQVSELSLELDSCREKLRLLIEQEKEESNFKDQALKAIKSTCMEYILKLELLLADYEYLIDKRVIQNFIVKYLQNSSDSKLKTSLLETLASILGLENDERKVLGIQLLPNNNNSNSIGLSSKGNDNIVELLRDFKNLIKKD